MIAPLSMHLDWKPVEAVRAKDAISAMADSDGYAALLDAIAKRETYITTELLTMDPTDQGAEYAQKIGQLTGLRELEPIVRGVIEYGRKAEFELRRQDEAVAA